MGESCGGCSLGCRSRYTASPWCHRSPDGSVTAWRRPKRDALPQLWDVVRGEMALVGPRPEDPRYVNRSDPLHHLVFGARPGITGPTALAYRDEETILANAAIDAARRAGRDLATD